MNHLGQGTFDQCVDSSQCALLLIILVFASGCLPDPELAFPSPALDFSVAIPEVVPRQDPIPTPDNGLLDLGMPNDEGLPKDDAGVDMTPAVPVLRTRGLDFVKIPQSTHNRAILSIRSRFLWHRPVEIEE